MILKDIGTYKDNVLNAFISSPQIGQLMLGDKYNAENAIDTLPYEHIFPFLYIEGTQDCTKSYLCFDVDIPIIPNVNIKNMRITIWVYCHKEIMKYSKKGYRGTRADILADMVERELGDDGRCMSFGIGKLRLESVTTLKSVNSNFYGKELIYTCPDFVRKQVSN